MFKFGLKFLPILIIFFFSLYYFKFIKTPTYHDKKLNIFFTETNKSRKYLTYKQLCSIESAAFHNPSASIFLFSLNARINRELLDNYKNIKFVLTTEENLYKDTPLLEWWKLQKEALNRGKYKIHDLSDSIRISLVYKYGGIYSDLDMLNLKSLEPLKNVNAVAYVKHGDQVHTSNAILLFNKKHNFLYTTMKNLVQNYKTNIWGYNGPSLIQKSVKKYCKLENIYKDLVFRVNREFSANRTNNQQDKCDVAILTNDYFFPVHWSDHKSLFEKNSIFNISTFKNAYGVHFYGKFSHYYDVKLNDNSIYEFFVAQNCPLIYSFLEKKLIRKI